MEYLLLGLIALAVPVLGVWGFFRTLSLSSRADHLASRADRLADRVGELEATLLAMRIPGSASDAMPRDTPEMAELAARIMRMGSPASGLVTTLPDTREQDQPASDAPADATPSDSPPAVLAEAMDAATPAEAEAEPSPPPSPALPVAALSLEETIGTRWVVWVGGIVLALGGVFLVRFSIEQGWFGPGARIAAGALFALALLAAGEAMRRRERAGGKRPGIGEFAPAHIPSVLTAAGTMAAFATVYAAHALYWFIGPAVAFVLLAAIGLATMAAAALHGPALAAMGLLGSLAVPLLVSSSNASPWPVIVYLIVVVASAYGLARLRAWLWLALVAAVGAFLWGFALIGFRPDSQFAAMAYLLAQTGLAAAVFVFASHRQDDDEASARADLTAAGVLAAFAALAVLLVMQGVGVVGGAVFCAAMAALLAGTALAIPAVAPVALLAPLLIGAALASWPADYDLPEHGRIVWQGQRGPLPETTEWFFAVFACMTGAAMGVSGWLRLMRAAALPWFASASYTAMAVLGPLAVLIVAWWRLSRFEASAPLGLVAGGVAVAMALAAARLRRHIVPVAAEVDGVPPQPARFGLEGFAAGALGAMALGLTMILDEGSLTVALSLAALGAAWVTTRTRLGLLRRMIGALGVVVLVRLMQDPTLVDGDLGATPIFNWLLWGYGVPAVSFGVASVLLRRQKDDEVVAICEGLAMALAYFLVAFEIRHALTGSLFTPVASHLEVGLQVFASLVFATVIVRLETVRRSAVLRIGSLVFGGLSLAGGVLGLLIVSNPLLGGAVQGGAVFNSLLVGYLLPAIAALALAWTARGRRPSWFVMAAAGLGFALQFTYTVVEIRHLFRGPDVSLMRGTSDAELYTYSVVFLAIGLVLLAIGIVRNSRMIRVVSGGYVLLAVGKAFLVDMAGLSGGLRALSFIGLGLALVGIGLVYQKLVFAPRVTSETPPDGAAPPVAEPSPPAATA